MLWAISAYFNPAGFHTRLRNYRTFRKNLGVALVTVEYSREGRFELSAGDAEVLLQVSGGDVMWQKERLLNLALASLPPDCTHVAWVDCDVVFGNADWPELAVNAMQEYPLVHLFGQASLLGPAEEAQTPGDDDVESFVKKMHRGGPAARILLTDSCTMKNRCSLGFAWAARRDLLDRHQFYDAGILGGGDRLLLCAALQESQAGIIRLYMNAGQARHFGSWARDFQKSVQGHIGFVDQPLIHLWHGDLENRRYVERHRGLSSFEFDPVGDIAVDENGVWRWSGTKTEMHRYVQGYFASRREDG